LFPGAGLRGPGRVQRTAPCGRRNSTGGGRERRRQRRPRRRRVPPCYEGSDAGIGHRVWAPQPSLHRAGLESVDRVLRVVAQFIWRLPSRDGSSGTAAGCRIRCACCAPRVLPLHFGHRPVRRLRSSINIATFPDAQVRTVSRFNLLPLLGDWRAGKAQSFGRFAQPAGAFSRPSKRGCYSSCQT